VVRIYIFKVRRREETRLKSALSEKGVSVVETPYIYRMIKRALAAHVPLFLTPTVGESDVSGASDLSASTNP
jgi:hypothetical protein